MKKSMIFFIIIHQKCWLFFSALDLTTRNILSQWLITVFVFIQCFGKHRENARCPVVTSGICLQLYMASDDLHTHRTMVSSKSSLQTVWTEQLADRRLVNVCALIRMWDAAVLLMLFPASLSFWKRPFPSALTACTLHDVINKCTPFLRVGQRSYCFLCQVL